MSSDVVIGLIVYLSLGIFYVGAHTGGWLTRKQDHSSWGLLLIGVIWPFHLIFILGQMFGDVFSV